MSINNVSLEVDEVAIAYGYLEDKVKELDGKIKELDGKIGKSTSGKLQIELSRKGWENCLNSKKKEIEEIRKKTSFMPCEMRERARKLHDHLLHYRKINAYFLQKNQHVELLKNYITLLEGQKKRLEKQFKEAIARKDEFKKIISDISGNVKNLEKEKELKKKFAKVTFLIMNKAEGGLPPEKVDGNFMDDPESYNKFRNAKKMIYDVSPDFFCFLKQAGKYRRILRACHQDIEGMLWKKETFDYYKVSFEKANKEYNDSLLRVSKEKEGCYTKFMDEMVAIINIKGLTTLERWSVTQNIDQRRVALCSENDVLDKWASVNQLKSELQRKCFEAVKAIKEKCPNVSISNNINNIGCQLRKKEQELQDAIDKHSIACQGVLECWRTSIPEHFWNALIKYEKAFDLLEEIEGNQDDTAAGSGDMQTVWNKKKRMLEKLKDWIIFYTKQIQNDMLSSVDYFMDDAEAFLKAQFVAYTGNMEQYTDSAFRGELYTLIGEYKEKWDLYSVICSKEIFPKTVPSLSLYSPPFDSDMPSVSEDKLCCLCSIQKDDPCPHDNLCMQQMDSASCNKEQVKQDRCCKDK